MSQYVAAITNGDYEYERETFLYDTKQNMK